MEQLLKDWFDQVTETSTEVDETYKLTLQIFNVAAYILMIFSGLTSGYYVSELYKLITKEGNGNTDQYDVTFGESYERGGIAPSGYAFAIWTPIYIGWGLFAVYQAMPSEWVPSRNDQLIFNDIGYIMTANMVLNASWFLFNSFNNSWFYNFGSFGSIVFMLGSALYILYQASSNSVDWIELVVLRGTFSLYSGWLSAAIILATKGLLQYLGLRDVNNIYPNEESWAIIILWVAFLIYQTTTEMWRNPLFGAVFTWAITACYDDVSKRGNLKSLESNIIAIDSIHTVSLFFYIAYFAYEKWGLELEEYGLMYEVTEAYFDF